jgi:hypothetical protein
MSVFPAIFIFIAIIALTAILFGGWVIVSIVRLLASAATTVFAPNHPTAPNQLTSAPLSTVRCGNRACLAQNPATARFCRRCGHGLPAAARVQVRRAAVW